MRLLRRRVNHKRCETNYIDESKKMRGLEMFTQNDRREFIYQEYVNLII